MPDKGVQDPNFFLDSIIRIMKLKNDAALARAIGVSPPVVSKLRHRRLPVTAALILKLYDYTSLSIEDLRALLYEEIVERTGADTVAPVAGAQA